MMKPVAPPNPKPSKNPDAAGDVEAAEMDDLAHLEEAAAGRLDPGQREAARRRFLWILAGLAVLAAGLSLLF